MTSTITPDLTSLPRDLLFDIICRLPPAILPRLRCVCTKFLHLLTSDHDFSSLYHRKRLIHPLLLFTTTSAASSSSSTKLSSYHYPTGTLHSRFSVSSSSSDHVTVLACNGVVCLIRKSKIKLHDPVLRRSASFRIGGAAGSTASFAFGYAPERKEFKIVRIYEMERFDRFHYGPVKDVACEVLSIPTAKIWLSSLEAEWRSLGICNFDFDVLSRKGNVCVDRCVYWLISERKYNPDCIRILSLDLETECFGIVCFPRWYSDRSVECVGLLEMGERLCLTDRLPWETKMDIWMMLDGGDEGRNVWCKKHCIDLAGIELRDFRIIGHVGDGDGDDQGKILIKLGDADFLVYDVGECSFRNLEIPVDGQDLQLVLKRKGLL